MAHLAKGSVFYPEIVQYCFVVVLCTKTSVPQIFVYVIPSAQSTIVKQLQVLRNYERDNPIGKAFLEHYQSANSSVAVLERVYGFKAVMKV